MLAQPPLFVVADGLGGHQAGEVASSMAVETVRDNAPRRPDAKALARAVRTANQEVLRAAREGIGREGMGTTLTAAIVEGTRIAIAHVGDSRAYLLHGTQLQRVTQDHSMVADMVRRGQLTEQESRVHPNRSVITRALGTDTDLEVDAFEVEASPGDRLLLCSDGLTGMLEDAVIAERLGAYRDPEVAAKMLVDSANDAGGQDNITVIVVDIPDEASATTRDRGPTRGRWLAVIAWLLALVLVIAGIAYGTYTYALTRAYAIDEGGYVAVYRGVPGEIVGIALSWPISRTTIPVSDLPLSRQRALRDGIQFDYDQARAIVEKYRSEAGTGSVDTRQ
jgi:protein phosphatase